MEVLPRPVKEKDQIPPSCSIGEYLPDIILRNDGFDAEVVYTFESFYAHGANILGNMARIRIDGAVLQILDGVTGKRIVNVNYLLRHDPLTTEVHISPTGIQSHQSTDTTQSVLASARYLDRSRRITRLKSNFQGHSR